MQSVECILAELNTKLNKESSVPFPEFGVNIILHHKEEGTYEDKIGEISLQEGRDRVQ